MIEVSHESLLENTIELDSQMLNKLLHGDNRDTYLKWKISNILGKCVVVSIYFNSIKTTLNVYSVKKSKNGLFSALRSYRFENASISALPKFMVSENGRACTETIINMRQTVMDDVQS